MNSKKPLIAVVVPPGTFAYSDFRMGKYFEPLVRVGAFPFALPLTNNMEVLSYLIDDADGVMITGGIDIDPVVYGGNRDSAQKYDPDFDSYEKQIFQMALAKEKPILGICRGLQVMNVFSGGSLIPDIPDHNNQSMHQIVEIQGILAKIFGSDTTMVNSLHHQGVDRLGDGFKAVARSHDGFIEAIEHVDHPFVVGVQWHPERLDDRNSLALFQAFCQQCCSSI